MPLTAYGAVVAHREITERSAWRAGADSANGVGASPRASNDGEMAAAMAPRAWATLEYGDEFFDSDVSGDWRPATTIRRRFRTISQALHYTEQPAISSRISQFVRLHQPNTVTGGRSHIIRDMAKFMELESRQHGATITLALSADIPLLMLDAFEVKQLMVNLIKNGLEAMASVAMAQRILTIGTKLAAANGWR